MPCVPLPLSCVRHAKQGKQITQPYGKHRCSCAWWLPPRPVATARKRRRGHGAPHVGSLCQGCLRQACGCGWPGAGLRPPGVAGPGLAAGDLHQAFGRAALGTFLPARCSPQPFVQERRRQEAGPVISASPQRCARLSSMGPTRPRAARAVCSPHLGLLLFCLGSYRACLPVLRSPAWGSPTAAPASFARPGLSEPPRRRELTASCSAAWTQPAPALPAPEPPHWVVAAAWSLPAEGCSEPPACPCSPGARLISPPGPGL